MKRLFLAALAVAVIVPGVVLAAGPNIGGALLIHGSPEGLTFCGDGQNAELPAACEDFVTRLDVSGAPPLGFFSWIIVAVFPSNVNPEVRAVVFGIEYEGVDPPTVTNCGDFLIGTGDWPASGSGVGMTWDDKQTDHILPVIHFESVNYYGDTGYFTVVNHPAQGAPIFGDDSIPTQEDPVEYFGTLGFFQDGELPCPPDALPPGACCLPNGTCQVRTEPECDDAGGSWLGEGTDCDPNPCPPPVGACCLPDGSCSDLTQAECAAAGGFWGGWESVCATYFCGQYGACCYLDGSCTFGRQTDCPTGQNAVWQGAGTICDPNPCVAAPTGACCDLAGSCSVTFQVNCSGPWTTWLIGEDCDPNPCPQRGACCRPVGDDWSCIFWLEARCLHETNNPTGSNFWIPDTPCDPNPCVIGPDPIGACCFADGTCQVRTEAHCDVSGGDWLGEGTNCNPNPCYQPLRVCCLPGNYCVLMTLAHCNAANGSWQYHLTSCDPNPCPVAPGACCFADGTCQVLIEAECESMNGSWEGGGISCHPNPCLGACCFADGSCWVMPEGLCSNVGTWMGSYTTCSPNPCESPVTGACCFNDGTCVLISEPDCLAQDGAWLGAGTGCDPNPCQPIPTIQGTWGRIKSTFVN